MEKLIVITPSHCLDPQLAIAACRAQAVGILDLGYCGLKGTLVPAIEKLASGAGAAAKWGVRWDTLGLPSRGTERLSEFLPRQVPTLILAGADHADLPSLRQQLKLLAHRVWAEVHDLTSARAAVAAGYDGLIIKGHEAGGGISRHATYILLQELHGRLDIPYWVQGGINVHSAAAAALAGATGVVLAEQVWLTDDSPLSSVGSRDTWSHLDGSETVLVGEENRSFRLFSRSGRDKLQELEQKVARNELWREYLLEQLSSDDDPLVPLGQDIAFAAPLARRYGTVGRILAAVTGSLQSTAALARTQQALAPDSPLARLHGTRYPIAQGPMTRVSDTSAFAKAVADGGGMPFLALSVMRKAQTEALLNKTKELLGNRPWGVGLLGFMPLELRQEQLEIVREIKPPFAIIAGGRPSQVRELDALSITSYLHVPSPSLLHGFLKEGARKFIFEGSECGGHTGPRTSFILWETAIEVLTTAPIDDPESVHVLFAGGIHDELSAAMLSVLAAPLVARGMKIGVVMGTAYLFTKEIVTTGAIVEEFQAQAIACRETSLLQSGVGIYTRCATTDFCGEFERVRRELLLASASREQTLKELELLNIGRLRIASKGISHNEQFNAAKGSDRYISVDLATQRREGLYMLGEVARLRDRALPIAELHAAVAAGAQDVLASVTVQAPAPKPPRQPAGEHDVAIIGMACLLPKAQNVATYWQNILRGVDAIVEVNEERWRPEDYFDPKRGTQDKSYSKWGGFLDPFQFDPTEYGIPPASMRSIEPVQLLALAVAKQALEDAGLDRRPFPRERTASIFAVGGMNELGTIYVFRTLLAHYLPRVPGLPDATRKHILQNLYEHELPRWTEDSFAGFLGNVVAGRVANRLDLGGSNFTVDAACASALAALDVGVKQLRNHDADVALVGAVDGTNSPVGFMAFAQTHALSPRGRSRPFDDGADGIALGEGVTALVLKRLNDATRDGDRIYAVIKGIGSSSDGRNRSLTAPHPQGQVRALRRAYEDAGVDLSTVGLIEAHGTGTAVGDKSEIDSLVAAFGTAENAPGVCAVGSVKSMIGHTKVAAGLAGLIKGALALKHRVLPPTIGVETPNSRVDFSKTAFYISTDTRPWLAHGKTHPRRCGVSAFGFGGTNFHAVLEEYQDGYRDVDFIDLNPRDAEPFVFFGPNRPYVMQAAERLLSGLEYPDQLNLAQLAYSAHIERRGPGADNGVRASRLAIVATSATDLKHKLELALRELRNDDTTEFRYPQGVFYRESPVTSPVCFLFPGQGSQKVNMLRDLVVARPDLASLFDHADTLLSGRAPQPLSTFIYPPPVFNDTDRARQQAALNTTQIAQPALGVAELAALTLLADFGVHPDFVAGHSYGEYVALCAAGVLNRDDLIRVSEIRGRIAAETSRHNPGAMAAVDADGERVKALLAQHHLPVSVANLNAPDQTIIGGPIDAIDAAAAALSKESLRVTKLPVAGAFHTAAMAPACDLLAGELAKIDFYEARIPVFSNTTATLYPTQANDVRALLARHLAEPVRFTDEIQHIYDAGVRLFVEVGPGLVLTGLVDRILGDRPHYALGVDAPGRPGWTQLAHLLAQLFVQGTPVQFQTWFKQRTLKDLPLPEVFAQARAKANPGPLVWRVNGGQAMPWNAPAQPVKAKNVVPLLPPATESSSTPLAAANQAAPAAPSAFPRPTVAKVQNSPIRQRYTSMNSNNEALSKASPPAGAALAASDPKLALIQTSLSQLLELQREQQRTFCSLLDFLQVNIVGGEVSSEIKAGAFAPMVAAPAIAAAVPNSTVPPAPVLPLQVRPSTTTDRLSVVPSAPVRATTPPTEPRAENASNTSTLSNTETVTAPANRPSGFAPTEEFKASLLKAASERTGYPEEMLDLNAHMEADLGIDSIKRIEIFSALKDQHNLMEGRDEETVLEELAGHQTLNEIITWYDQMRQLATGGPDPKKASTPLSPLPVEMVESEISAEEPDRVGCYALTPVPAPVEAQALSCTPAQRLMFVLGAASEASEAICHAIAALGYTSWQLVPGEQSRVLGAGCFEVDFSSPTLGDELRCLIEEIGLPLGGLINLSGLAYADEQPPVTGSPARNLFLTLKMLESQLKPNGEESDCWLINVTAFDGQFGLRRTTPFSVDAAGTLGVAKTAACEWPHLRVRCIDLEPGLATSEWTSLVVKELQQPDGALEIGFTSEGRWRLDLQLQNDDERGSDNIDSLLDKQAVVLVTGGAYGITAEITMALARTQALRLVIVGRSPMPEPEAATTRDIHGMGELRMHLINDLKNKGIKVKPIEIESLLRDILKQRQIRNTFAALQAAGADIEYHAIDVRNAQDFGKLLDDIYARYGRIDGVIHGAGIVEDKLIRDKSVDSFDSVYATKVVPALILSEKLRPEFLKFLVLFSSVAGRFGNAGQSDYSAANEVLNKLADRLSIEWPNVHTVSINWGPWEGGMVSDELKKLFARRNIQAIPVASGVRHCMNVLNRHIPGQSELVITASLAEIAAHGRSDQPDSSQVRQQAVA